MKKAISSVIATVLVVVILLAIEFTPRSIQIVLAATATCNKPALEAEALWWPRAVEWPVALTFHARDWIAGQKPLISRLGTTESYSAYQMLLVEYGEHGSKCNKAITSLMQRYAELKVSPDAYGAHGYTPLLQFVLFSQLEFVKIIISAGADPSLLVRGRPSPTNGMNALELAKYLYDRNQKPEQLAVLQFLSNEISKIDTKTSPLNIPE